ncbi:MAG TPA: response regulator [Burkholderiales bacterium]|nr:response regulator [Burkholderiales bacterium]
MAKWERSVRHEMTEYTKNNACADSPPCILFLDDDERILRTLRTMFCSRYDVITAADGAVALSHMRRRHVHVAVSDQRMPGMTGSEFLSRVKDISPNTMRVLLTGYSEISSVIEAINDSEVFRFITKPWDNDRIQNLIGEAVEIGVELAAKTRPTTAGLVQLSDRAARRIMVISYSKPLYQKVAELTKDAYEALHARTLYDALITLESGEVAVIVAESAPESEDVGLFLKLVKQEYPDVVTILLTPTADVDAAISLINQAQLFRLLTMPVLTEALKVNIDAALGHALLLRGAPIMRRRHSVEVVPEGKQPVVCGALQESLGKLSDRLKRKSSGELIRDL